MSTSEAILRELTASQAADWFVANRAGLSEKERQKFTEWLRTSPLHVEEYLGISVIARDMREACEPLRDSISELLQEAAAPPAPPMTTRSWQPVGWAVAAVAILCVGLLLLWPLRPELRGLSPGELVAPAASTLHFQTRHAEQATHRLADDSLMHLNTDSAVSVAYEDSERLITLTSGEADFEVAHNARRPFRVLAGAAEIVDVGTKFDVRLQDDFTVITVAEGRVAIRSSAMTHRGSGSADTEFAVQFAEAGQQVRVAEGEPPSAPVTVDADRATSWLHRKITFEREPLQQVATEFNRYAVKPIEIATPALRNLEISGVFATDDTDAFIAFLRSLEGVRVEVTASRIRVWQN
jgi:transmembrane sensor